MRKRLGIALPAIIAVVVLGASFLAAWAFLGEAGRSVEPSSVRRLIGLSQANLSEPWRIAMTEEIRREAAAHSDMRVIVTDAVDSYGRQVADVEHLLAYGIDLLIISPTDSAALTPIVAQAYRSLPVIVLDRAVEGYAYTLYIGPDNRLIGRETGRYVSELLGARGGTVLEVAGREGSPPTIDRSAGLREEISKYPGIRIVDAVTADWLRDRAEDILVDKFAVSRAPDAIVAQNDAMAFGAWLAARRSGLGPIDIIGVDGLGGTNGGLDLVDKGILSATFICPTGGKEAVDYAIDILDKKDGIPKKIYLRTRKVTAGTIASATPPPDAADVTAPPDDADAPAPPDAADATAPPDDADAPAAPDAAEGRGAPQVGSESRWRIANTRSVVEAARKAGIELHFVDGKQKQENQIEAIRSFIGMGVDVIAFSPIVEKGWEGVLAEAKAAGIPVFLSDREVDLQDDSLWLTFVGSDFMEEGRRAARWLIGYMKDRKNADGQVRIVELRGTEGSAPALDRNRGFEATIAGHDGFSIVRSETANFYLDQGRDRMREILASETGRIDVLFAHNDDMALGAIEAIEDAGLVPGKDIVIVSVDAIREAFVAMIAGKLNCTVECTPLLGPQLMKVVQDYMAGKDLPTRIVTSEEVFPAEIAKKAISERKY